MAFQKWFSFQSFELEMGSNANQQLALYLRRRPAVDNTPSQHMEMSMLQQVNPRQENYTESRAVALHNVESTISELGGIFTHLATMVVEQGELAIRSGFFLGYLLSACFI